MEIRLGKEVEQRLTESVQRYLSESFEEPVGDLKASLFLRFCVEEIGPAIYHQAIADAQAYLQERVADLENVCFVPEKPRRSSATASRKVRR